MSKPETRSGSIEGTEADIHWAHDPDTQAAIAKLARDLGVDLRDADTFQVVFKVDRLRDFEGTPEQAKERLRWWAVLRERALIDTLVFDAPEHAEAKAIAWTNIITPDGVQISVTAREGASVDSVVATTLALTGTLRKLERLGFVSTKTRR